MKKAIINYIIDFFLFLSFLTLSFTGIVLHFVFKSGIRARGSIDFIGLSRHDWISIHDWSAIIFGILILIHFILHFTWIKQMTINFFKKNNKT